MYASVFIFILAGISSICAGQNNTCNVFPKDKYIEVGESITITCQSSCIDGKIYWTLNNVKFNSLSKTLNSTHTVLSLSNFTHPSATLQCHSAKTHQVIGGTTIGTYSKPRNISCTLHHTYQEEAGVPDLLTCTWEHQMHLSVAVTYTVEIFFHLEREMILHCKSQETKCTFKEVIASPTDSVTVWVNANTDVWNVFSDNCTFKLRNILKTLRPKELDVTEKNPGHLVVSWKRLSPLDPCDCEVRCSKVSAKGEIVECDRNEIENTSTSIPATIRHWSIFINNVESCSTYTFSVRCALEDALWSDWSKEKSHLTKPHKKGVSVDLWRKVSELGKNGLRKVHVMWMVIPSTCEGTFKYTINQTTGVNSKLCGNTTCDVDINQDAQRITLTVSHDKGFHVEKSVYVPAVSESLPEVTDIRTSSNDNIIQVSWKAPVQPVSKYVIDWTHNGGQYYWKESSYTNATLFDLLDKKPYNITVTPLIDDKTGQSAQAVQVCSRFGDPDGIAIRVEADHRSASVSWDTTSQSECSGAVINYTVYYYEGQNGPVLNVSVDSKTKNVSLKDLNPDTQYTVYVNATALTGRTKSSERKFTTKKFDPRLLTVLIVSGTIVIILVLLLGLCFAVQWKKFKDKPVPNPSLSSVGVWAAQNQQKRICFQPFSNPSESPCDTVYPENSQSTPSLVTGSETNTASDYTEDYTNSGMTLAPHLQDESPVEPVVMPPSPGESTALISSEGSPVNPYRSQSSVESPVPRATKQIKLVSVKQQEKTPLKTVYVTLDMIKQDHGR
ncbi:LOW QUALITY PROTEIN: interleukin-6 receptor subunit beta-like [Archocentrus centrarchus]|uniref:LOW QUALITY PROTEIN: interleukin-6 receptor subunit beta-like n=1 Tax=Archocentrus centrarchus TaxID=63155 RepID=UPI0011E9E2AC|nr:LOW QUALITY PROTEIN: interleukin-6 receptor subunit beta-like [Archocentrus centrarchus]